MWWQITRITKIENTKFRQLETSLSMAMNPLPPFIINQKSNKLKKKTQSKDNYWLFWSSLLLFLSIALVMKINKKGQKGSIKHSIEAPTPKHRETKSREMIIQHQNEKCYGWLWWVWGCGVQWEVMMMVMLMLMCGRGWMWGRGK